MTHREPGSIVVGVDVGGSKKGFHAVALQDGQYRRRLSTPIAEEVAVWCRRLTAAVVGIDAPCRWSLTGRARPCERALAAEGLNEGTQRGSGLAITHSGFKDGVRSWTMRCLRSA